MRPATHSWDFAAHERSPLPGAPATPDHPFARCIGYGAIGVLLAITGGLRTGIVAVNLPYLQGGLGLYQNEIACLPAVYVMTKVPAEMALIKHRQQFELRSFALIFQALYCVLTFAHLFLRVPSQPRAGRNRRRSCHIGRNAAIGDQLGGGWQQLVGDQPFYKATAWTQP